MFRGLPFVRLKAAEQALRAGRLDDALRMAGEPDLAEHPRGGRFRAQLAEALLARAREHYRAERFTEALLDLGRLDRCGGQEAEAAELREQVLTVAQEVARQEGDRKRRLEQARRCVEGGSLAAGKRLLQSMAGSDTEFDKLHKEMTDREKRAAELVAQAEALLKRNHVEEAVEHLVRARRIDAGNETALRLETTICDAALTDARRAFDEGRLGAANAALERLHSLGQHRDDLAAVAELLNVARQSAQDVTDHRYDDALQHLHRLLHLAPKTGWAKQAAAQVQRIEETCRTLRSGPLGGVVDPPRRRVPTSTDPIDVAETIAVGHRSPARGAATPAPLALLLLVNGGGSYLLLRGERASIGRATTGHPADMPILSDLSERHADVARVEDDYFLMSPHEVEVSGRRTRHQLMRDGDRVVLARRAKFTFRVPNRKSPSARIELSDSTKMPNDVRQVVLFKDTAMMGRRTNCHIACRSAQEDLVLYERGGQLWVRPQGRGGGADAQAIEMGKPMEIEGVSFVVQPWTVRASGVF